MSTILVTYYSRTGNTKAMAHHIAAGAREAGAKVDLLPVESVSPETLLPYRAIIIGSPDYYGLMAAPVKKLLDDSVKLHGQLAGKIGGAFSSSANIGGGNETTIISILLAMLVHGMIIPGVAVGDHYGPVAINAPDERAIRQCHNYGKLIANLSAKLT
ncbi:MAG: NAD(P)H-dependent oxidoreductase [bacterium]|nr:NAD(P)H-dependent oxidoreductase [bacterium]